jgi:hypothetical protein
LSYSKLNQKNPTKTAKENSRQERQYISMRDTKNISDSDQQSLFFGVSTAPGFV